MIQDPHRVVFDKKFTSFFEQILFQPKYKIFDIGRRRDIDLMRLLIRKENFEASAELDSDRIGGGHGTSPGVGKSITRSPKLITITRGGVLGRA
jgi:hypothetical protein